MPYLKNQFGRIVCVDDPKQYEQWSKTDGFQKLTKKEEEDYIKSRYELAAEKKEYREVENRKEYRKAVYIATVASGGKDGYGTASTKLINELKKLGVDISPYYDNQKIGILFHNPYSVLKMETPYRIIFTMFESTKIPDDWLPYLEAADKVVTPTKWGRDVFAKSGVKAEVLPLGFDDTIFTYKARQNKRKLRKDFIFLHYNAFNIRKGFLEVFKAFYQEFKRDEPVKMIFKTNLRHIPLPITKEKYPNIEIISDSYSERQLAALCQKADCFVFPSRGEGFGMTPLEAMGTGCPVIIPNAHGLSEYFNSECMYEVNVESECPALYSRYKGMDVGKMVVCDIDDLRAKMRYVYEHQDEAIEKGKMAAEYVKDWTFKKTAVKLKVLLEEVMALEMEDKPSRHILNLVKI
jgi:glycosyltransferase involved in cell wall biosynthesis